MQKGLAKKYGREPYDVEEKPVFLHRTLGIALRQLQYGNKRRTLAGSASVLPKDRKMVAMFANS
ncbi:hypothetical protein JCM10914_4891 [Paenibacillus sp. JCM 10914]|nr:hypothetical protein JCM10914_4891 [Paenibacillus sp. JCM 10914]